MFDGRYHIANCGQVFCLTPYNHANLISEYWCLLNPFKWFRGALSDARWKNANTTSVGSQISCYLQTLCLTANDGGVGGLSVAVNAQMTDAIRDLSNRASVEESLPIFLIIKDLDNVNNFMRMTQGTDSPKAFKLPMLTSDIQSLFLADVIIAAIT